MNIKITEKDEPTTRFLDCGRDEKQEATIPKRFWAYFDWLSKIGDDVEDFIKHTIVMRAHHGKILSFNHQLMGQLHWDERSRYLTGKSCPLLITPEGYDHEDYLGSPTDAGYEPIGRMLKNAFGVDELVVLNKGYWEYFDWCCEQEGDMVAWVQYVDEKRPIEKSFGNHLMFVLWYDMCRAYRNGDPYPFDTPPNGYRE